MEIGQHLAAHRSEILGRWLDAFLSPYPAEGAAFFAAQRDRFSNPVGSSATDALSTLLDHLAGNESSDAAAALEALARLRAVQELEPSRALAFVQALKPILRESLAGEIDDPVMVGLEDAVDRLLLRAADAYLACRERLFDLRAREARSRVHSLLRRAELLVDDADAAPDSSLEPREGRS